MSSVCRSHLIVVRMYVCTVGYEDEKDVRWRSKRFDDDRRCQIVLRAIRKGWSLLHSQGQYWIEYLYLLLATPPYMAAANFVVITNGGGCALAGTADIDQ